MRIIKTVIKWLRKRSQHFLRRGTSDKDSIAAELYRNMGVYGTAWSRWSYNGDGDLHIERINPFEIYIKELESSDEDE